MTRIECYLGAQTCIEMAEIEWNEKTAKGDIKDKAKRKKQDQNDRYREDGNKQGQHAVKNRDMDREQI